MSYSLRAIAGAQRDPMCAMQYYALLRHLLRALVTIRHFNRILKS